MNDGLGALQSATRTLNRVLSCRSARSAKLLKASGNNLGEMGLFVAISDLDRFFQLAVFQSAGNLRRKLARLLAGSREVQVAVDHHGQRPDRLNEENDGNRAGRPSHMLPQPQGAETNR